MLLFREPQEFVNVSPFVIIFEVFNHEGNVVPVPRLGGDKRSLSQHSLLVGKVMT